MFNVIYATNTQGQRTRFVVGCRDLADALACDLCNHDFTVLVETVHASPAGSPR